MSVPSRLRWLLPGYNCMPEVYAWGREVLRASNTFFASTAGRQFVVSLHLVAVPSARPTTFRASSSSSSTIEATADLRTSSETAEATPEGSSQPDAQPPVTSALGAPTLGPRPATSPHRATDLSQGNVGPNPTSGADYLEHPTAVIGKGGISGGGNGAGGDAWNRLGGLVRQARRSSPRRKRDPDGQAPMELTARVQRLRESLGLPRGSGGAATHASGGAASAAAALMPPEPARADGPGGSNGMKSGSRVNRGGSDGAEEPPALHWRRAAASSAAGRSVQVRDEVRRSDTAAEAEGMMAGEVFVGAGEHTSAGAKDGEVPADVTSPGEHAAAPADRAVGGGLQKPPYGTSTGAEEEEAVSAGSSMPAVAAGGGVVGTLRIIQRTAGGVGARTAAATDRDADLLSRIAELRNLRDAELLVYDAGSWFRSKHAAKLLARLPELDLQTSNSGPRTRRMIRFLSAATLRDLSPLPGPDLARCLAAFARLTYVPPEIVAPICAALTAAGSRKLRACSGTELAELAWGLASLEQLYGDMHQAVRQPARAVAQLASGGGGGGARVVGYVRGGGDSGVLGVRVGSGEQVGPQLVQKLTAAAEEEDGTAEVAAAATEGTTKAEGPQPAAAEAVEETKTTLHRSGDGVDRARASSSSSSSGGDGADSKVVQAAATSCADHALASSLPSALEEKEEEEVAAAAVARTTNDGSSSGGGGGGGGGGGRLLSTTRGRQHRHHDRAHAAPVMVWLVPRAMDRIWERLAAAAGLCAERGGMQGEQLAKVSWAYARVGRTDQRLYDKLSAAALVLMEPFQKRIQAAAAEAVSEPRYGVGGSRRSSSSAAAAAVARSGVAPPLDPTSVTTLAWAFVAAGRRDPPLLAALATVAASYKGVFENDQVVTLARSYAQARHYDEALCTAFAMVASRRHRHLTGRQLTALIGALAALGHRDDELGGPRLARMVWDKKGDLSAEEVCELMWACAQLGLDEQRGPAGLGFGVLGLGPADGAARPTSPSSSRSLTSSLSPRSKLAAAANAAAGSIGGRGGGGGAAATSATLALATALRGRCEGLTPVDLARALWASSLLLLPLLHEPGYSHHAVQQLLWDLVSEVRQQLVRHPPESFSQDALLQLYGAAQLLGPAVPPSVTGRDMGSVELAGGYQSGVEEEGKGEGKAAPADRLIGLQDERDGEAADVVQRDRGRLYGRAAAGSGSAAAVRMYGTEAITQSGLQAQADQRQHDPQAQQEKHEQPEKEQQHRHRQHRPRATWGRRVSGFTEFGPNPYDGSWSDVDWGRIRVAADAAVPQLTPTQAGADPRVTHGRGATSPKRRMKYSFDSANETTAAALPSSEYDVRKMYDEASGRELWEVVPKARAGGAGAGDVEGPLAARVLPAALLRACQAAAAEWAAAERLRLEAVEAQEAELWRLDVAAALRDLTAAEPLLRWVAPDNTAVADFLVLQPPPPLPAQSRTSGAAAYGVTAPAPLAVLLVGDTECTRNPPFMPLGWARMRQRLLEASGARVLVVPYFLWGMVGESPDEQICLLANLLGQQR